MKLRTFAAICIVIIGVYYSYVAYAQPEPVVETPQVQAEEPEPDLEPTLSIEGLYELTNKERVAVGLPALALDPKLNQSALDKCNHMVENNYWAHDAPDGTKPRYFIDKYIDANAIGENLARGYDDNGVITTGWMNSPKHKENILRQNFDHVGFAHCKGFQTFVVQHFSDVL